MDATLVTSWTGLCQTLESAFTGPTFITFVHMATGWVLCRSKPTVTNLVRTIGPRLLGHVAKHWTVYERFFYRSAWSPQVLSRLLLSEVVAPLVESEGEQASATDKVMDLSLDDTTCGRWGKHVAWAGYFKDASAGNTLKTVVHWAHNWVIGAVTLRPRKFAPWVTALPVLCALYRKRGDCDKRHPFHTRQQLAAQMVQQAHEALPDWTLRVAADGAYATRGMIEPLPEGVNLVSRLRRDAALYELPPKPRCRRRRRGRPPLKGKRLPTPVQIAARRKKGWQTIEVRKGNRTVMRLVLSIVCLWYHVCRDRPIKLVIVRDPAGKQADDFFFCTDPTVSEVEIVERYYARWPIEEAIQEGKQLMGMEQTQGWCRRTVERQVPFALMVQTLVKAWYLRHGVKAGSAGLKGPDACGWMPQKNHPSYLDMLATLRSVLWDARINCKSLWGVRVRHILQTLRFTLCAAA